MAHYRHRRFFGIQEKEAAYYLSIDSRCQRGDRFVLTYRGKKINGVDLILAERVKKSNTVSKTVDRECKKEYNYGKEIFWKNTLSISAITTRLPGRMSKYALL